MKFRVHDPEWFVPRLTIQDEMGALRAIRRPRPEQWQIIRYIERHPNVLIVKPRQIGSTTITQGWSWWKGYTCPDPINILTMTHEYQACGRVNNMLRTFHRGMPLPLRPKLYPDNSFAIGLSHNGVTFRQHMAGGKGQGRSHTNHVFIATEMAFWPQGSAHVKGGTAADRDAWASILATMHKGPHRKVIVESTGDGPTGQFFDLVRLAQDSPEWGFLFFRWSDFPMYSRDVPPDWARTPEEEELARQYGLTDEQLAWRRYKLVDEGYTAMRFRREYPIKWDDPFTLSETVWFDGELVEKLRSRLPQRWKRDSFVGALRVYHDPEPDRTYFIGMDTAGGVGKDYSVIVVLRDDYEVAAVWSTNRVEPTRQADKASEISAMYNRAVVLCEENKYGKGVIQRMEELGVPTWKNDKGRNFSSQGLTTSKSKAEVYSYARRKVNSQIACSVGEGQPACINDEAILEEMSWVRENEKGNIEAPEGYHDDHVDAYVLALWCGRYYYLRGETPVDLRAARARRIQRMVRG